MTEAECKRLIAVIEKTTQELLAKGPQACLDFLVEAGINNPDGTLTKEYGGLYTERRKRNRD